MPTCDTVASLRWVYVNWMHQFYVLVEKVEYVQFMLKRHDFSNGGTNGY